MPIKIGDLIASVPGQNYTMISDGKRLRVLWEAAHGHGDPSTHLVDRCINTKIGHPTWKLFCGNVTEPIVRGKNEPPHYAYLDDCACYAVLVSQQYTKQELRAFWPFDFDQTGKIRTRRMNRGRPAYVDDSCREYATGPLRGNKKGVPLYVFTGASEPPEPSAPRPGKGKLEEGIIQIEPTIAASTIPRLGSGRISYEHSRPVSGRYMSGPTDGSLEPIGMACKAIQGPPYFEEPAAMYRSKPRPQGGDLAITLGLLGASGAKRTRGEVEEEDSGVKKAKIEE
jgi:hypothetical protein